MPHGIRRRQQDLPNPDLTLWSLEFVWMRDAANDVCSAAWAASEDASLLQPANAFYNARRLLPLTLRTSLSVSVANQFMRPHTCGGVSVFATRGPPEGEGEEDDDTATEPGHAVRKSPELIRVPEALASTREDEVVRPQLQRSCHVWVAALSTPEAREEHPRKGQTAKHAGVWFDQEAEC
ncbi:hypothetical protein CERZMDRAFT_95579 [Cercospora zeae-maydis SCOH1-5]|uniref:Uncharacterized protein n=1 Tax=Cercospora zeae-maydis SCOH1-5 TaxID=717836 RepID=A0A6A6FLP1_9PEZI|nr:hypothetical protein CERZMDRAFT_95579 [Cercospora zeae-maydis SCOH1-5]